MNEFHTSYQKFDLPDENEQPANEDAYLMHVPDNDKALWHHIEDLDSFFIRVYQYYQNHGFMYILSQMFLQLTEFVFIVGLLTFLSSCVDYNVLFANNVPPTNFTGKVSIDDVVYSSAVCSSRIARNPLLIFFLIVATCVGIFRCGKILYNIFQLNEIRRFFRKALHIKPEELDELSWQEIQQRLIKVQEEQQMCIHKQQLTELDIYNRILRFKNFMIAMVNKGLLPPRFRLPFLGDTVFFTEGLKYNIEFIFFWGPRALFSNRFHLKDEYKIRSKREELAQKLSSELLRMGLINLVLSPFIFFWQVWYTFLSYTDLLKREPGAFGARTWSLYARHYFRHFNELPHEFQGRLNRGYKHAKLYMESFSSPILSLYAKTVAFIVGSFLAVLVVLTIWDIDVLEVEHLFAIGAGLTFVVHICRTLIPDENAASCPDRLMRRVIAEVHYAPDSWRGQEHTYLVRDQFAQLFQYKAVYILEELLSPIITPFILIFWMRPRSMRYIDFIRHFTIDIAGVGDVCSFAQLDINKHGDPKWHDTSQDEPAYFQKADDGKVELSLMHFAVTNPKWIVPKEEDKFLSAVKMNMPALSEAAVPQNLLSSSLNVDATMRPMTIREALADSRMGSYLPGFNKGAENNQYPAPTAGYPGAMASFSNPQGGSKDGVDSRLLHPGASTSNSLLDVKPLLPNRLDSIDRRREMTSMEMSMSALYMHEMHHQRLHNIHARMMWETIPDKPDTDESALTSHRTFAKDQEEAVQIFPDSIPAVQTGYDSMASLNAEEIFGNLAQEESRDKKSEVGSQERTVPFLSVSPVAPIDNPNGATSANDSYQIGYGVNNMHGDIRTSPNSNSGYQPPKM